MGFILYLHGEPCRPIYKNEIICLYLKRVYYTIILLQTYTIAYIKKSFSKLMQCSIY